MWTGSPYDILIGEFPLPNIICSCLQHDKPLMSLGFTCKVQLTLPIHYSWSTNHNHLDADIKCAKQAQREHLPLLYLGFQLNNRYIDWWIVDYSKHYYWLIIEYVSYCKLKVVSLVDSQVIVQNKLMEKKQRFNLII